MSYRRKKVDALPAWLWFFLVLPIGLMVMLLYRRKSPARPAPARRPLRYIEPDSIPLKMDTRPADTRTATADSRPEGNVEAAAVAPKTAAAPKTPPPGAKEIPAPTNGGAGSPTPPAAADDLKAIEGIGPAIAALLAKNGMLTFQQLANTPIARLSEILGEARLGHLADPQTWPEQARLAARGEWEQLSAFQNTLKAGRKKNK